MNIKIDETIKQYLLYLIYQDFMKLDPAIHEQPIKPTISDGNKFLIYLALKEMNDE